MTSTKTSVPPPSLAAPPPPRWIVAAAVFITTALIYGTLAVWAGRTKSPTMAYYPALAGAFAQGRLDLGIPPITRDLTPHNGVWHLAFSPLPAILMLPEAWIRGADAVNSVRYSITFGAAAAAFVFLLLDSMSRRGWTRLSLGDNLWLTALFACGSVALYMSLAGTVWLTSQVVAVAFIAAAAWLSVDAPSPLPAGTALALAILSRPSSALMWPFLVGLVLQRLRQHRRATFRRILAWAGISLLPVALAVVGLLAYNVARFGDPLDFGYTTMNVSPDLAAGFERYGQFDIHFVVRNLRWMVFGLPQWDPDCGFLVPSPWGMSLFLTMPALVFLVRASSKSPWAVGAWTSIGLTLPVLLLYHNTGYYQFGYRFSLDFLVPAVVLLSSAAQDRLSTLFRTLIVLGIGVNFAGMAWIFEKWCAP